MSAWRSLWADRAGAVSMDWTALTAGVVIVAVAVIYAIGSEGFGTLSGEGALGEGSVEEVEVPLSEGGNDYYAAACTGSGAWCVFDTTGDGRIDSESEDSGSTITALPEGSYLTVNEMIELHGFVVP